MRTLPLYKDLSARDLLQRRATDATTGATTWADSPLVEAAKSGHVLLLDGVDRLPPDVLASLQQLAQVYESEPFSYCARLPGSAYTIQGSSRCAVCTCILY